MRKEQKAHKFGLLGRHISYSFSRGYFSKKFEDEQLPHAYVNFDVNDIEAFIEILKHEKNLKGFNITIPYKEQIIPFLNSLNKHAENIGAVNTVKISKKGKLKGYNTDYYGFKKSLKPYLKPHHNKALILGTGGASKAIIYALKQLDIKFNIVSRTKKSGVNYNYEDLDENIINSHQIIINCTPVGTFPKVDECPNIPYQFLLKTHLLYDLIYNPSETKFLSYGREADATTINGLKMLELQAEKAWHIWNK